MKFGDYFTMSCNGICERFKAKKNPSISSRYAQGQKDVVFVKYS
jgi:hypothetical protein